jgi:hypothetical protein
MAAGAGPGQALALACRCGPVRPPGAPPGCERSLCGAQADEALAFDWDDAEGNSKRRLAGLALEARRLAESRRLKAEMKARGEQLASLGPKKKH